MMTPPLRLSVLLLLILTSLQAATEPSSSQCLPSELQALRAFAASFDSKVDGSSLEEVDLGESWAGEDCCSWLGVTCTHINNSSQINHVVQNHTNSHDVAARVSELELWSLVLNISNVRKLSGGHDILRPLCNLRFLSSLYLVYLNHQKLPESFYVPLPECLGDLPNLSDVGLNSWSLSGPLPPFLHTPLLKSLDLSDNSFNWTQIDNFIRHSNLPSLEMLDLSYNLISGPLPYSITRLSLSLTDLSLSGNLLSGTLPNWLCELSSLTDLDLYDNHLVGSAEVLTPECQAGLINLTGLDLSNNQFTGPFPKHFDRSPSLGYLSLSSNNLSGPLPEEWQNLQSLYTLDLSGNSLTSSSTPLPEWIFRLPNLRSLHLSSLKLKSQDLHCSTKLSLLNQTLSLLDLSDNLLTGLDLFSCFTLHNFTNLHILKLAKNPLSVLLTDIHLPPTISIFDLSSCGLKGHINNTFLEALNSSLITAINLADNHLVGKVPMCIINFSGLFNLDLSHNGFDGFQGDNCMQNRNSSLRRADPSSFSNLYVSNNVIAGDLSSVLQSLGKWMEIDLSHNELRGEIPASVGRWMEGLRRLKLNHNHLVGRIPHEVGDLKKLITLTLNNNQLEGTIPSSLFTSISSLTLLDLSYNQLQGDLNTLSSVFSDLKSLRALLLAHNNLTGTIPSFYGSLLPGLQLIDLSHNHLTGPIPQDLHLPSFDQDNKPVLLKHRDDSTLYEEVPLVIKGLEETYPYILQVFTSLDLSSNHLIGSIPTQLGTLSSLQYLNLAHNNLSGSIPATLGSLSMLQSLDLSFNKLEGSIPSDLSSLTKLGLFNVSFNEALTGKIPTGPQLDDSESYIGDQLLCGFPTLQDCKLPGIQADPAEDAPTMKEKTRNVLAKWMDEWISFGGLSLGIVVGFIGTLWLLHGSQVLLLMNPRFGAL